MKSFKGGALEMEIVRARPEDAATLTAIAFAAKRHWGYPDGWIQRWAGSLTISAEYISAHPTYSALVDHTIVGFCAVQFQDGDAVLDHLWVLPGAMGRGIGRALFAYAETIARQAGAHRLRIEGDPHAEGFYQRMGATVYGQEPATMDDCVRFLPLLEKRL